MFKSIQWWAKITDPSTKKINITIQIHILLNLIKSILILMESWLIRFKANMCQLIWYRISRWWVIRVCQIEWWIRYQEMCIGNQGMFYLVGKDDFLCWSFIFCSRIFDINEIMHEFSLHIKRESTLWRRNMCFIRALKVRWSYERCFLMDKDG